MKFSIWVWSENVAQNYISQINWGGFVVRCSWYMSKSFYSKSEDITPFLKAEVHLDSHNLVSFMLYRYGKIHFFRVISAFAQVQGVNTLPLNQHLLQRRAAAHIFLCAESTDEMCLKSQCSVLCLSGACRTLLFNLLWFSNYIAICPSTFFAEWLQFSSHLVFASLQHVLHLALLLLLVFVLLNSYLCNLNPFVNFNNEHYLCSVWLYLPKWEVRWPKWGTLNKTEDLKAEKGAVDFYVQRKKGSSIAKK